MKHNCLNCSCFIKNKFTDDGVQDWCIFKQPDIETPEKENECFYFGVKSKNNMN